MDHLPEPWLRGPIPDVDPLLAPILYAFQQAGEDLARHTEGLTGPQLWAEPYGLGSVGFHIRHIAGSIERLTCYLEGRDLTAEQIEVLHREETAGGLGRDELLVDLDRSMRRTEALVRSLDVAILAEARTVGRKRLPSSVIGLLTHIAEHTQRHVGQAISAARLAKALD